MIVQKSMPTLLTCIAALLATMPATGRAAIRVVTYNVDADTDRNGDKSLTAADGTYATASVATVLEAIGGYALNKNAQAPDVISVQEPYGTPSVTLSSIVGYLNSYYGANTYDYDRTVGATTDSTSTGNGPNGLIYKTSTIHVNAVTQIGTPDGDGEARAPLRYQLTALGATSNNTFYLYDEHTKASTFSGASNDTTNGQRRTIELDAVRHDADSLPSGAHAIFTGDLNLTNGSSETGYQDLLAASGTTLSTNGTASGSGAKIVAGAGRAYDPLTSTFTTSSDTYAKYYSESDSSLTARFDFQLLTANTLTTSTSLGLRLVDKTELAFGNSYYNASGVLSTLNGSGDSITDNNVAATTGYSTATLNALLAATDHLPVVADYAIVVPEPTTLGAISVGVVAIVRRRRVVR